MTRRNISVEFAFFMKYQTLYLIIAGVLVPQVLWADGKPLTDGDIRNYIVAGSLSNYTDVCPCPYSFDAQKNVCGDNSEYIKNPGSLKCYTGDVTPDEIAQYRRENDAVKPYLPWNKEKKEGY